MAKRRLLKLSIIAVMVAGVGSAIVVWKPRRVQSPIILTARERIPAMVEKLRTCDSLEAIKQQYGCYTTTPSQIVDLSGAGRKHTTYVSVFSDGRWIACVGAFGYGPEEMPLVTRDSTGEICAFTYVPMGRLSLEADSLEKAYEELSRRAREVPIGR